MAKYSENLKEKIVNLIEEDGYSITDICKALNISRKSFYMWRDEKPEFGKEIREAAERRDEKIAAQARLSLKRKLEGYTLTETKWKYVPDEDNPGELKLKEKIVKVKEYVPDNRTIMIALDRDPVNKDRPEEKATPLHITVVDDNTRRQLEILRENAGRRPDNGRLPEQKLQVKTG